MKYLIPVVSFFLFASAVSASEKLYFLSPYYNGASKVVFKFLGAEGNQTLQGELIDGENFSHGIPDVCEHEGGDPEIYDAYTTNAGKVFFVFTCKWEVLHSGINLKGTDYISYVYDGKNLDALSNNFYLAAGVSGYEGALERGGRSFFWYSSRYLASEKIKELAAGLKFDSLELAHQIILARLKDADYDAIKAYLTNDRVVGLLKNSPVSVSNSSIYNDLGFALGESGALSEAYNILSSVEAVSPERVVLKLNIADVLWKSNQEKSAKYYFNYIEAMKAKGKEKLIPVRAFERSGGK